MLNRLIKILTVIRLVQSIWWDGFNLFGLIADRLFTLFCIVLLAWAFVVIFL